VNEQPQVPIAFAFFEPAFVEFILVVDIVGCSWSSENKMCWIPYLQDLSWIFNSSRHSCSRDSSREVSVT